MAVKLTGDQMITMKSMVGIAGSMADQFLHIMRNSGLDKVDGCRIQVIVNPAMNFVTSMVDFGSPDSDAGFIKVTRGKRDEQYKPSGDCNSAEYELLFADEAVRERMSEILHKEKPLPPDGLWIGDDRSTAPLDCRGIEMRFDDLPVRGAINR